MLKYILHIGILILFITCPISPGWCQQGMYFSNYIQDATAFNPAYAGSQGALSITAQYRSRGSRANGAPASQGISVHAPVWTHNLGLGIRLTNDRVAGFAQQSASPSLAYRIKLSEKRFIAAGLQAGFVRQHPEFRNLLILDPDDPAFAMVPPAFSSSAGTGFFYGSEKFYAGFAIPDLFPDLGGKFRQPAYRAPERAYIVHAGWVFSINPEIKLKPNALVVIPENGMLYADANLLLLLRDVLWLGGSYRLGQGMSAMAQLQLNPQLAAGYSYDLPVEGRGTMGVSSHEISLQYRFFFVKSDIKSPRYF